MKRQLAAAVAALSLTVAMVGTAQTPEQSAPTSNPMIDKIYEAGKASDNVAKLAQALMDSIGPRLAGTPRYNAAVDWAVAKLTEWGIPAKKVAYSKWTAWDRGHTHMDMTSPRLRTLEATLLAWSPGTNGQWIQGQVIRIPEGITAPDFDKWLTEGGVKGKFVLTSFAQPTCRPDSDWKQWAAVGDFEQVSSERTAAERKFAAQLQALGKNPKQLAKALEDAGAAAILTNNWSKGWGVEKIFGTRTHKIPSLHISCEDYGLLDRLAANNQGPMVRLNADSKDLGEIDAYNVVAEIKGSEKPDEYVLLSAHFDSWDGSSGATDNGTGSVTMLEAIRLLKELYPNPKRTIIIGLWGGEEQGLNGSRGFVRDRPEVVKGLQALFNQDNGTGQVGTISMEGLTQADSYFTRWLGMVPTKIAGDIKLVSPGQASGGGTDHASFICAGAPAFNLTSTSWNYGTYTWHTNRDTYDKISINNVKSNATLTAMLAYLASEESTMIPRTRTGSGARCAAPAPDATGFAK